MEDRSCRPFHGTGAFLTPLLIALIPLSLVRPASDPSAILHGSGDEAIFPSRNYIVRFLEYGLVGDHRAYLVEKLGSWSGWKWVERKNPATAFPTDFGVLEIRDPDRASVLVELRKLKQVKDVSVDTSYSRSLFVESPKRGTLYDFEKRPGKIFTSMSFEGQEGLNNSVGKASVSWRRKLMIQVTHF